jgi:hypothetical protein
VAETRPQADSRVGRLTETYRLILERYGRIEELSTRERELLEGGAGAADVNPLLRQKRDLLAEIRREETRMSEDREWWKRTRRALPTASCGELLAMLDAITRIIERIVSLEEECRGLLQRSLERGRFPVSSGAARGAAAALAYARSAQVAGGEA